MADFFLKFGLLTMALFYPFSISGLQLGLAIATIGWLFKEKKRIPLIFPIILFTFASLISIPFSIDPLHSFIKAKVLFSAIAFVVIATAPSTLMKRFITILIFSTASAASLGIFQEIADWGRRIGGTVGPQTFSALLMPILLLEISLLLFDKRKFLIPTILVSMLALIFTYTRSIYIATIIGIGLILYTKRRLWILPYIVVLFILIMATYKAGLVKSIIFPFNSASPRYFSDMDRVETYKSVIAILKDRPITAITGIGIGGYQKIAPNYLTIDPHHMRIANDFLHIWIERGVFALLAYIFLIASFIKKGFQIFRDVRSSFVIGALAGFIGLIVSSLFEPRFTSGHVNIAVYILMGIGIRREKIY
jgi:O-antigen ligase